MCVDVSVPDDRFPRELPVVKKRYIRDVRPALWLCRMARAVGCQVVRAYSEHQNTAFSLHFLRLSLTTKLQLCCILFCGGSCDQQESTGIVEECRR